MRLVGLLLIVVGWIVAVGGLLATDDVTVRMVAALVGLGTSLSGMMTLAGAHNADAIWKTKGAR
jgi:hypothetical protein